VILGQLDVSKSVELQNLQIWAWTVKGLYPLILLFDIYTTKTIMRSPRSHRSPPSVHFESKERSSVLSTFSKIAAERKERSSVLSTFSKIVAVKPDPLSSDPNAYNQLPILQFSEASQGSASSAH
jgi:hypothetical protein